MEKESRTIGPRDGHPPGVVAVGAGPELSRDENYAVRLAVQRQCLRTRLRLHRLFHNEAGRTFFLDYRQRAVAMRTKCFHRFGIEYSWRLQFPILDHRRPSTSMVWLTTGIDQYTHEDSEAYYCMPAL